MSRINEYVGPKESVRKDALFRYTSDKWLAQEKHDGVWALISTDEYGKIESIISRTGLQHPDEYTRGFIGLGIGLTSSKLVAELEAGTQAATKRFKRNGYRKIWFFDVIQLLGKDIHELSLEQRLHLLKRALPSSRNFSIVRTSNSNLEQFYDEVMAAGGEGIVLKQKDSKYISEYSSGKTTKWVRCKPTNTLDFFVMGTGLTESRVPNLELGLYKNGKLCYVQSLTVPKGYRAKELVGKVIECVGDVQMDSGALRHARFKRVRNDKNPEACT